MQALGKEKTRCRVQHLCFESGPEHLNDKRILRSHDAVVSFAFRISFSNTTHSIFPVRVRGLLEGTIWRRGCASTENTLSCCHRIKPLSAAGLPQRPHFVSVDCLSMGAQRAILAIWTIRKESIEHRWITDTLLASSCLPVSCYWRRPRLHRTGQHCQNSGSDGSPPGSKALQEGTPFVSTRPGRRSRQYRLLLVPLLTVDFVPQ